MIGMPPEMMPPEFQEDEMPLGPEMQPQPGQMPLNDEAFSGGELTQILKALLVEQAQARQSASQQFQSQAQQQNDQQFGVSY